MIEVGMVVEEIGIALRTGRCPRCGLPLSLDINPDDWSMRCEHCKTVWGGSI